MKGRVDRADPQGRKAAAGYACRGVETTRVSAVWPGTFRAGGWACHGTSPDAPPDTSPDTPPDAPGGSGCEWRCPHASLLHGRPAVPGSPPGIPTACCEHRWGSERAAEAGMGQRAALISAARRPTASRCSSGRMATNSGLANSILSSIGSCRGLRPVSPAHPLPGTNRREEAELRQAFGARSGLFGARPAWGPRARLVPGFRHVRRRPAGPLVCASGCRVANELGMTDPNSPWSPASTQTTME